MQILALPEGALNDAPVYLGCTRLPHPIPCFSEQVGKQAESCAELISDFGQADAILGQRGHTVGADRRKSLFVTYHAHEAHVLRRRLRRARHHRVELGRNLE